MAATHPSGASSPHEPVVPAVAASATLALQVPVGATLDDAAAPAWETSLGDSAPGDAPAAGGLDLTGSVLTPRTVRAGTLPPRVEAAYVAAADRTAKDQPACGLPWWLLAGVGQVESGHAAGGRVRDDGVTLRPIRGPRLDGTLAGTAVVRDSDAGAMDGDPAYDRAVGPMQFMPGTWASWGADGDGDGREDADDVDDAALAAARYLCQGAVGGALAGQSGQAAALFRYNRSVSYGLEVIRWGIGFRDGRAAPLVPSLPGPAASAPPAAGAPDEPPRTATDPPPPAGSGDDRAPGGAAPGGGSVTQQPGTDPSTPPEPTPSTDHGTAAGTAPSSPPDSTPGAGEPSGAPLPGSSSPTVPPCAPPAPPPTTAPPTTAPPASPTGEPTAASEPDDAGAPCAPPCPPPEGAVSAPGPDGSAPAASTGAGAGASGGSSPSPSPSPEGATSPGPVTSTGEPSDPAAPPVCAPAAAPGEPSQGSDPGAAPTPTPVAADR